MKFQDIYQYFRNPPPQYLNKELAVCYVLAVLLEKDSYGTELIQSLELNYPGFRLSDTVLYNALRFLEEENLITGYWYKVAGRGRPRRMYRIALLSRQLAEELAGLWHNYVERYGGQN